MCLIKISAVLIGIQTTYCWLLVLLTSRQGRQDLEKIVNPPHFKRFMVGLCVQHLQLWVFGNVCINSFWWLSMCICRKPNFPIICSHRVFSAFIKEVDGKTNTDTIWGKKSSFGSCLSEFSNGRGMYM